MMAKLLSGLGAILVFTGVAACDRDASRTDGTGQTTTTASEAEANRKVEAVGDKLSQAGEKVGEAAAGAAASAKKELKEEWKDLDVHVEGSGTAPAARDGGASRKTR